MGRYYRSLNNKYRGVGKILEMGRAKIAIKHVKHIKILSQKPRPLSLHDRTN